MFTSRNIRTASILAGLVMAFSMVTVDYADARRGGSFGSRGARTDQSAPATNTAPAAAPVQRSMTPAPGPASAAGSAAAQGQRGGFMSGFGGRLLTGLAIGGLFGMLMGSGFGGLAGLFGMIFQIALIGGLIWLAMRFFRSRQPKPASANGGGLDRQALNRQAYDDNAARGATGGMSGIGARLGGGMRSSAKPANPDEIGVTGVDLATFERMLADIQGAYGREDYAALRSLTTPEMMGYFSEELGQNASNGLKNEVSDVTLLQGDVAESWREGVREYATVAMRYSSIDATRERASGKVVDGDDTVATESTEVWTFVREGRGSWLLSAIQEA